MTSNHLRQNKRYLKWVHNKYTVKWMKMMSQRLGGEMDV